MGSKKRGLHRARGRPPSSQRLRPEDCAIVNATNLEHATLDQFTPFFETLMLYCEIPKQQRLYSRMIDATMDWPDGSRVALQLEVEATRQHFGGVRQWYSNRATKILGNSLQRRDVSADKSAFP